MYNSDVDSWRGFQPFFFFFSSLVQISKCIRPNVIWIRANVHVQDLNFKFIASNIWAKQWDETWSKRQIWKHDHRYTHKHIHCTLLHPWTTGMWIFFLWRRYDKYAQILTSQFQMAAFFNYRNIHRNKEDSLKLWLKPLKALFKPINWFYFTFCRKLLNSVCKTNLDQNTISFRINYEVRNGKQFSMSRLDIVTKVTRMCEVEIFWFYSHDME